MSTMDQSVAAFRQSVSPNLLSRDDFIDWSSIDAQLATLTVGTHQLESFAAGGIWTAEALADELVSHPSIYPVILNLIAYSSSQVTKWGLTPEPPRDRSAAQYVADQLVYIGLPKLLDDRPDVEQLLRVAEVYKDSVRRRFRSGKKLEVRVENLIRYAVKEAKELSALPVRLDASSLPDYQLRRSVEYVVSVEKRPVAAIATVFQNQSGGRQQRDLSITYPLLQDRLAAVGVALILIADGQGLREASDRTLVTLFESVRYPMSLNQAADGFLREALLDVVKNPQEVTVDQAAINRIILGLLESRGVAEATDMPMSHNQAVLVLARFAETHKHLALQLSAASDQIAWSRPGEVQRAKNLIGQFEPHEALKLFADLLGTNSSEIAADGEISFAVQSMPDDALFTNKVLVAAIRSAMTNSIAKSMGIHAMQDCPGSSVAFLLQPLSLAPAEIESHRKRQSVYTVNIVVLGAADLLSMARAASPRRQGVAALLNQSNLTKASPFVLSNATPERMFYGRESEAATIKQQISTNSVAILGSRRIGKTSLMRRLYADLREAGFQPYFGDCQTVRTWEGFAALAQNEWGVRAPKNFTPRHLMSIVDQLSKRADGQVVILLDEIDQLLEWDRTQSLDSVPEAFFRACRSLSQEGRAQFIFSGERTIATRLWDPHSPHWNFCRPIELRQLTRDAASALLVTPLQSMNIRIEDIGAFTAEAWLRTSGHHQIVQHLGDRLVRMLDKQTDRTNLSLNASDIVSVTSTYEFAEHYLHTYWGQATDLEKALSLVIAQSPASADQLEIRLRSEGIREDGDIGQALRMLHLYGIIEESEQGFALRAVWFPEALAHYGGVTAVVGRMATRAAS